VSGAPSEFIYGRNPVAEARRGRRRVLREFTADDVGGAELERLCGSPDHQAIVAEVEPFPYAEPGSLLERPDALVIALDQIQDPRNLGAICRTASAAGAAGVVICERRASGVTAAVCKASAGAVEHLAVARVTNMADFLIGARERGAWSYGADADATTDYRTLDLDGRSILVLGAEGSGLRPRVAGACDELVRIPTAGPVASLNVSVAAAVLAFSAGRVQGAGA
jgi:23S rRNA (guanosine2251-2'-O)-methyltransferase